MKHTTEELILAAHVRKLAAQIREAESPIDLEPEEQLHWAQLHPIRWYVPKALGKIEDIADEIKKLRR